MTYSKPAVQLGRMFVIPSVYPAQAGKVFAVKVTGVVLNRTTIEVRPSSYSCRAMIGPLALHGSGTSGCTWAIPATARGKAIGVAVTVTYQSAHRTAFSKFAID